MSSPLDTYPRSWTISLWCLWGFIYPVSRLGTSPRHGEQSLIQFQGCLLLIPFNIKIFKFPVLEIRGESIPGVYEVRKIIRHVIDA